MRINLTKKDLINQIYMQLGFSKLVSENLINDFLSTVILNLKEEKKLKLSGFGTFSIRRKKSRIGRNHKTKEPTIIAQGSDRILVELPGLKDPAYIKSLLGKTAKLTFRFLAINEKEQFGVDILKSNTDWSILRPSDFSLEDKNQHLIFPIA